MKLNEVGPYNRVFISEFQDVLANHLNGLDPVETMHVVANLRFRIDEYLEWLYMHTKYAEYKAVDETP